VSNAGGDPATGEKVAEALPAGLTIAGNTPSQGTYDGSTLERRDAARGASATLTLSATIRRGNRGVG
jgi:hypothetical protein